MKTLFSFALAAPLILALGVAEAQTAPALPPAKPVIASNFVPADEVKRTADKPQGFAYGVTLAANLNVASNNDVVGQVNGNALLFGASVLTRLSYLKGAHEWLNTGSLNETFSRTPAVDEFLKSNDLLDVQSLYNYFLRDWTGPFVRVALQTSIFKNEKVTASDVTYVDADAPDGTAGVTSRRFRLSDAGQPFTLNESVGWFFQPVRSDVFNTYGRIGLGGRHTFADGARAIKDDSDATATTYTVLNDVHQAGAELFAGVDGKEFEGRLLYNGGLSALFPLLNNDETDRSILKLTKVALQAAVGMGVFSWLSVNYQLKVIRDLQLVDAIQVQNALLLSLQWAKSSPTPSAPKSDADLAKERMAELEARAITAERRAAEAEARAAASAAGSGSVAPPAQPEPPVGSPPPPPAP
jgi:hypothetical protein